jgi:hypothetical protein
VWMRDAFLKRYIREGKQLPLPPNNAPSLQVADGQQTCPTTILSPSLDVNLSSRNILRVSKKVMLLCYSRLNPNIQPSHSKLTAFFSGPHSSEQYLLQVSKYPISNQEHYSPSLPICSHLPQSLQNPTIQTFPVHLQEMSLVRLDQHMYLRLALSSIVAIRNDDIYDLWFVQKVE